MQSYYETEETERLDFARLAAKHFEENPLDVTLTKGGPVAGAFMALRWGMGCDCVAVIKIDDCAPIINYCQFIDRDKAWHSIEAHNAGKAYLNKLREAGI